MSNAFNTLIQDVSMLFEIAQKPRSQRDQFESDFYSATSRYYLLEPGSGYDVQGKAFKLGDVVEILTKIEGGYKYGLVTEITQNSKVRVEKIEFNPGQAPYRIKMKGQTLLKTTSVKILHSLLT